MWATWIGILLSVGPIFARSGAGSESSGGSSPRELTFAIIAPVIPKPIRKT